MKNKKAQAINIHNLPSLILFLVILFGIVVPILTSISNLSKPCPQCEDCSPYKTTTSNLSDQLKICENKSKQIVYVNQTDESPIVITREIYKERWFPVTVISISFALSLYVTLSLFKIEITLPEKIKKIIDKIEKWIIGVKLASLIVTILLFIKICLIIFGK